jgi:AcrR family transcriptional regulator
MNGAPDDHSARQRARKQGREEVESACIRAAADLFSERNPSQVSVRDIAARAGVSHALVHRYLGSKEDILAKALELLRWEAAEYWMESQGDMDATFTVDLPPGRYVRAVMRVALDDELVGHIGELRLPRAEQMLHVMGSLGPEDERPFDPRLILSATIAMTAAMSLAREFFLEQGGIGPDEADEMIPELRRLVYTMLSLAEKTGDEPTLRDVS